MDAHAIEKAAAAAGCPFHALGGLPEDGTQLMPSASLAELRSSAAATPLKYTGDHTGWLVTDYELAKQVLGDDRFSQKSTRFPDRQGGHPLADIGKDLGSLIDEDAIEALTVANVLALDSPQHEKVRRAMITRFMVKAVRGRGAEVRAIVARQLDRLKEHGSPADITMEYGHPISAYVHCLVLGVPERFIERYVAEYEDAAPQAQFDLVREVLAEKADSLAEDALSDLLRAGLSRHEIEGAAWILMSVGRDNVARMISTMTVALLSNPDQLAVLRDDPSLMPGAVEEILRFGTPFLGLFVRTATDDFKLDGYTFEAGQSVTVSAVAANRDPKRFDHPDEFDVSRDAFGHLGFGFGAHSCVGQQLARIEIREAVSALIEGLPDLRLVHADQLGPMPFANPVGMHDTGTVVVEW
jgi:cytochrome P450